VLAVGHWTGAWAWPERAAALLQRVGKGVDGVHVGRQYGEGHAFAGEALAQGPVNGAPRHLFRQNGQRVPQADQSL